MNSDKKTNNNEVRPEQAIDELFSNDDTWAELSQDWQTQSVHKTDINALVRQTRRRTYAAKLCFALNVMVTVGLFIAFIYGLYDGQLGQPVNTYFGVGAFLSAIFTYVEIKIRLVTWRQLCDSPEKAIENAIVACQSSIKYMQMTKISFLPFLLLMNWFVYVVGQTEQKDVLLAFFLANGVLLLMYLLVDYLHRKRKKQYQQLLSNLPE